ncbi:hypothetical protein PHISCL_02346 [Aspergillus sclerotialis]|uniref:Uncharacterized protein n=1 Tax=Aspergillus sclerotialis TaxID=2070753 RepID=A0A3A2ZVB0_9EURO|nr:hypothetical protein PHISCL_02346 [Aspergillus sclerotialis]
MSDILPAFNLAGGVFASAVPENWMFPINEPFEAYLDSTSPGLQIPHGRKLNSQTGYKLT